MTLPPFNPETAAYYWTRAVWGSDAYVGSHELVGRWYCLRCQVPILKMGAGSRVYGTICCHTRIPAAVWADIPDGWGTVYAVSVAGAAVSTNPSIYPYPLGGYWVWHNMHKSSSRYAPTYTWKEDPFDDTNIAPSLDA